MADPSASSSSFFFDCGASMEGEGANFEEGELGAIAARGVRGSGGRAGRLGGAPADPQAGPMAAAVGGRGGAGREAHDGIGGAIRQQNCLWWWGEAVAEDKP